MWRKVGIRRKQYARREKERIFLLVRNVGRQERKELFGIQYGIRRRDGRGKSKQKRRGKR